MGYANVRVDAMSRHALYLVRMDIAHDQEAAFNDLHAFWQADLPAQYRQPQVASQE